MTMVGNRPEWVEAMVACWRIGAAAQPCVEQLRPQDLRARMDLVEPARGDRRRAQRGHACATAASTARCSTVPDERLYEAAPAPAADLGPDDPALIVFTSGTAGEPKPIRHGQRYLPGQRAQAEHWFGARPGRPLLVHGRQRLVEVRPQRLRRPLADGRRRRCCTTAASTPPNGSS